MAKPLFLATADWHVDRNNWADRPDLCGDSVFAVRQIVDLALQHKVKAVIAAGDILERKVNESWPIGALRDEVDRLKDSGVHLLYVDGQHDGLGPDDRPWLHSIHSWPVHLECGPGWKCKLGSFTVAGLDWTPSDVLPKRLDTLAAAPADIVVMHQVHEMFTRSGNCELTYQQVPGAKLLIVGDYHVHNSVKAHNREGLAIRVLSPGSTNLRDISEDADKRVYLVYDDLRVESLGLQTRTCIRIKDIMTEASLARFVHGIRPRIAEATEEAQAAGLPAMLQKPILEVPYHVSLQGAYRMILETVGDSAHLFPVELVPEDEETASLSQEEKKQRETILSGGLVACLPLAVPDRKGKLFHLVRRLLLSDQPTAELLQMRTEAGLNGSAAEVGDDDAE